MAAYSEIHLRRDNTVDFDGLATKTLDGVTTPVDLTGATLTLVAKKWFGGDPVLELTSAGGGGIDIDADQVANTGAYRLTIAADATAGDDWPIDKAAYLPFELVVEEATGEKTTLAYGVIKYVPDVT